MGGLAGECAICSTRRITPSRAGMTFLESSSRSSFFLEPDLFRPGFARRSVKPDDDPGPGFAQAGKPVPTFRDHALIRPPRHPRCNMGIEFKSSARDYRGYGDKPPAVR